MGLSSALMYGSPSQSDEQCQMDNYLERRELRFRHFHFGPAWILRFLKWRMEKYTSKINLQWRH